MVNAGKGWAEGITYEAESNQGGSAACPTMPTGFADWPLILVLLVHKNIYLTVVRWVPWAVKSRRGEEMWCSAVLGAVRFVG